LKGFACLNLLEKATDTMKQDIYERITGKIIAELEKGARPWIKPWNAGHAAGR